MINFCTLFDSNYLTRGLALYESLSKVCPSFHLYVIAFNDDCFHFLKNSNFENLTPISLKDFEDQELLKIKPTRSGAEYCWTCTPSVVLYCIKQYKLPSCIYVDADMIFYQNPQIILNEIGDKSILITEHRYTKEYDQCELSGIYCVQFLYFKNNVEGLNALNWWRDRCIEWCYARSEDGKFGDQKYLDDWLTRFNGVHVMQHLGGGVAPWNVQQFQCEQKGTSIYLRERRTGIEVPLVFFHFHGLKFFSDNIVSYSGTLYELSDEVKNLIFAPYVKELQRLEKKIQSEGIKFNVNGSRGKSPQKQKIYANFLRERLKLFTTGKISFARLLNLNIQKHYHFHKLTHHGQAD